MTVRASVWRLVERLMSFLPSPPDDSPPRSPFADPNEPGLSADEREARLEVMRKSLEKEGRGGFR